MAQNLAWTPTAAALEVWGSLPRIAFPGGLSGIIIGIALAKVVAAYAGWPTVITLWSQFLSTAVSVTVGLVSGIFPAARAARYE